MDDNVCKFCGREHKTRSKPEFRIIQESGDYQLIRKSLYYSDGHGARTCYYVQHKEFPVQDPFEMATITVALEVLYALSKKPRPVAKKPGEIGTKVWQGSKYQVTRNGHIYKIAVLKDDKVVIQDETGTVISTPIQIGKIYKGFTQDFFDCMASFKRATYRDAKTGIGIHLILDRENLRIMRVELAEDPRPYAKNLEKKNSKKRK